MLVNMRRQAGSSLGPTPQAYRERVLERLEKMGLTDCGNTSFASESPFGDFAARRNAHHGSIYGRFRIRFQASCAVIQSLSRGGEPLFLWDPFGWRNSWFALRAGVEDAIAVILDEHG